MIFSHTNIIAREHFSSSLSHNNISSYYRLTTKFFNAKSPSSAIASVFRRSTSFFCCPLERASCCNSLPFPRTSPGRAALLFRFSFSNFSNSCNLFAAGTRAKPAIAPDKTMPANTGSSSNTNNRAPTPTTHATHVKSPLWINIVGNNSNSYNNFPSHIDAGNNDTTQESVKIFST